MFRKLTTECLQSLLSRYQGQMNRIQNNNWTDLFGPFQACQLIAQMISGELQKRNYESLDKSLKS